MGCQTNFSKASTASIVAFFFAFLTNFCNWLAFTTTSWYVTELPLDANGDIHMGLWMQCRTHLMSGCVNLDGWGDSTFGAVQAFAVVGFSFVNLGHVLVSLYIFWDSLRKNSEMGFIGGIVLILSGLFWTVAAVVFALGVDEDNAELHYSFGFAVTAAIMAVITSFIMIYAAKADQTATEPAKKSFYG